ncbi:MAG: hypothetical protein K2M34_02585 [Alphaproteobacteria bacterium]|nr:hypothetical protein [Alphaproteobacteria bacterium]
MKTKSVLVAVLVAATSLTCSWRAGALTAGQTCPHPAVSSWRVYKCDCTNDGRHSACSADTVSKGYKSCYLHDAYGGNGDDALWICAPAAGAVCDVCNCDMKSDWDWFGNNMVRRTIYMNTSTDAYICSLTGAYEYGCDAGYYSVGSGNISCYQCPTDSTYEENEGDSDVGNNSGISACYMHAGVTGRDASGIFKYTQDCNYPY